MWWLLFGFGGFGFFYRFGFHLLDDVMHEPPMRCAHTSYILYVQYVK